MIQWLKLASHQLPKILRPYCFPRCCCGWRPCRISVKLPKKSPHLLFLSLQSSSDLFLYYCDNAILMLPSLQIWSSLPWTWVTTHPGVYGCFTETIVMISLHSFPFSPPPLPLNHTAQHALLEDIKSLRPLGSPSSTGIRIFVTVFSSWRSVVCFFFFNISSTLNFYVWFNASGFTHINCLKGWNHIWNENSRMKNSDCWMELNFSATERKLYGLIFTTL